MTVPFSDVPGQPLHENWVHASVKDDFRVWLSWHPGEREKDAKPTPLAMVTWSWTAEADAKDLTETDCAKRWTVSKQNSKGGTGKPTTSLPAIPANIAPNDLKSEKGSC